MKNETDEDVSTLLTLRCNAQSRISRVIMSRRFSGEGTLALIQYQAMGRKHLAFGLCAMFDPAG